MHVVINFISFRVFILFCLVIYKHNEQSRGRNTLTNLQLYLCVIRLGMRMICVLEWVWFAITNGRTHARAYMCAFICVHERALTLKNAVVCNNFLSILTNLK